MMRSSFIRAFTFLSAICLTVNFVGCAKLQKMAADSRLADYQKVQDRHLVKVFYHLSADGTKEGLIPELEKAGFEFEKLSDSSLSIEREIAGEPNWEMLNRQMSRYNYNSAADPLAEKYIAAVKARNNKVRLYKLSMSGLINKLFQQPFITGKGDRVWYNLDNALIEYDSGGRIISFMVRAHHAMLGWGVTDRQYTTIYFGSGNARHLENNLPNSAFSEYFIREL